MSNMTIRAFTGLTTMLVLLFFSSCHGQTARKGGDWVAYGDALIQAQKQNKKVLVDVYTDWCGWCKKMDRDVYANAQVSSYLKENYVIVKLNAESSNKHKVGNQMMTEAEIASEWGIRSYPSTAFLNPDGSVITLVPGYIDSATFRPMLTYILEDHYKNTTWNTFHEQWKKK